MMMTIADSTSYYYLWIAVRAILPIALGAFFTGLGLAWLLWGGGWRKGSK